MTQRRAQLQPRFLPYLLLVPAFFIAGLVLIYPLVNGMVLSTTSYSLIDPGYRWVGLANFRSILSDPVYWEVFLNSIVIIGSAVVIQLAVGMAVALLLNTRVPLRGAFRSSVFIIWIIPQIVISLLWLIMYNSEYGILNYALKGIGVIGEYVVWLGRPWPARIAHIITHGWRGVPFFMVMILAALQTIPTDIVDAARIDGAGSFQRFPGHHGALHPAHRRPFRPAVRREAVPGHHADDHPHPGGPVYATTTLGIYVYKEAFIGFQMGRASAIGVTWLVFLILLAAVYVAHGHEDRVQEVGGRR